MDIKARPSALLAMYIESVPNRNSPPAILPRESYCENGKVCKRTLCNLSDWLTAHIEGLHGVLKGSTVIAPIAKLSPLPVPCRKVMLPRCSVVRKRSDLTAFSELRAADVAISSSL